MKEEKHVEAAKMLSSENLWSFEDQTLCGVCVWRNSVVHFSFPLNPFSDSSELFSAK